MVPRVMNSSGIGVVKVWATLSLVVRFTVTSFLASELRLAVMVALPETNNLSALIETSTGVSILSS